MKKPLPPAANAALRRQMMAYLKAAMAANAMMEASRRLPVTAFRRILDDNGKPLVDAPDFPRDH